MWKMQAATHVKACKKVRAGRLDTSKFVNSDVRDGQSENIAKLGNLYSGQVKLEGGGRKAEKTEETAEEEEDEEDGEKVRVEKRRRPHRRRRMRMW